jgi:S1-C subfamily serine protease
VVLEKGGMPVAIGTVLGSDGRILTALSGLAGGEGADVLYADGTTVHAKVGASDRANDLALLVPAAMKWTEGLPASETDPAGQALRAILPGRSQKLAPAEVGVKGTTEVHSKEGNPLLPMLDVDVKGPLIAGAPLLDASGAVAAVLVRACKGALPGPAAETPFAAWGGLPQAPAKVAACTPVIVGAPVNAIRAFLTRPAPAAAPAAAPAPFLGIRGEPDTGGSVHGVKVLAVAPQGPADKAGLKPGADVIVAVEGQSVDTPEKLSDAIGKHAPGDTVKLLVFGQDRFREVPVVLRAAPSGG